MTLLLQVSDPHFGTERPAVVAALERLCATLRPDVLLLSGDITQRATTAQFTAARAFVERLAVPVCLALPGNHDIPLFNLAQRLFSPYARFSAAFGSVLAPGFDDADVLLQSVNTTRWWRHADGQVSAAQVSQVVQRLALDHSPRWKLVMVHQPLAVTRAEDAKNLLHGHAQALASWRAAGVDVVLGGHIHLPYVLPLADAPGGKLLWVVQAGTAISQRVRAEAGNSVNVLRLLAGPPRVGVVERWDCHAGRGEFEQVAVRRLEAAQPQA